MTLMDKVKRGAELLDTLGDWCNIVQLFNSKRPFIMENCGDCVLAHVFGGYHAGLKATNTAGNENIEFDYGFDYTYYHNAEFESKYTKAQWTDIWRGEILYRRHA